MLPFEREVAEFHREVARYDSAGLIPQFGSLIGANQYRLLYTLTARFVPAGSHVLDWGTGRGHFAYYLVRHGFRVTAYSLESEPEIFAALSPEERCRLEFFRGSDPVRLPFADHSFSAAFSVGVLEHVRDVGGAEEASLDELRRILAPGGVLVVYHLPNRLSYIEALSRWIHERYTFGERVRPHRHLFSADAIRLLLAARGFVLIAEGRYGFIPRNSWSYSPHSLRRSAGLSAFVNRADLVLARLFTPFAQNLYAVARSSTTSQAHEWVVI